MRVFAGSLGAGLFACTIVGCATSMPISPVVTSSAVKSEAPVIIQAAYSPDEAKPPAAILKAPGSADEFRSSNLAESHAVALPELIERTLQQNPLLAKVSWAIEAARGQAVQAGLYPNPSLNVTGNEISDRTGPGGIWSVYTGQEIVTANKLGLAQAAALKEVDQATLRLLTERYRVFTSVRQAYFEAVTLQRRAEILTELVKLAQRTVDNADKLRQAKEVAELDVVQLEVDLERYRAELEATERALPGALRKLAASVGVEDMKIGRVIGDLDATIPIYDLERVRGYVLGIHPELRSAQVGVERARLVLHRAEVEPIPNVTVGTGYTYQGQNRSNDWDIGLSVPMPVWNKNQGNIHTARARVSESVNEVSRVQNELVGRLADAYRNYAAASTRAQRYRKAILPKAQRTYELSLKGYQGGQFEYLRVLQAQRAMAEANLELVRALGEMWQAASEIAGLMLEDQWPLPPATLPGAGRLP